MKGHIDDSLFNYNFLILRYYCSFVNYTGSYDFDCIVINLHTNIINMYNIYNELIYTFQSFEKLIEYLYIDVKVYCMSNIFKYLLLPSQDKIIKCHVNLLNKILDNLLNKVEIKDSYKTIKQYLKIKFPYLKFGDIQFRLQ